MARVHAAGNLIPALIKWSNKGAESSLALLEEAILLSHESLAMIQYCHEPISRFTKGAGPFFFLVVLVGNSVMTL